MALGQKEGRLFCGPPLQAGWGPDALAVNPAPTSCYQLSAQRLIVTSPTSGPQMADLFLLS